MTSFIAAGGSGRSTRLIPAAPAASSVTTIAFMQQLPVSSPRLDGMFGSTTSAWFRKADRRSLATGRSAHSMSLPYRRLSRSGFGAELHTKHPLLLFERPHDLDEDVLRREIDRAEPIH